jgi:ankyrin repeat protein
MRDARTRGETALHRAAAFGSPDTVRMLLEAGATVDAEDMYGETPLAWASWHLRPDAVLRQLTYGGISIHPARDSGYDHGRGWGGLEAHLLGTPHV